MTPLLDLTVKRGGTASYASMDDKNIIPFIEENFLPPQALDPKLLISPTRPKNNTTDNGSFEKKDLENKYLPHDD